MNNCIGCEYYNPLLPVCKAWVCIRKEQQKEDKVEKEEKHE